MPRLIALGVRSLKIEGRLKSPEYVAATTRLYRAAVDAAAGGAPVEQAPAQTRPCRCTAAARGPASSAGIDHQRLVDGQTCEHRGLRVGTCAGVRRVRGEPQLVVRPSEAIARGDGMVVAGGREGAGEVGGRIWRILAGGKEVERAPSGARGEPVAGPLGGRSPARPAGRAVFRTSDPAADREVRAAPPAHGGAGPAAVGDRGRAR